MTDRRLPNGGRVDRNRPLNFTYNGKPMTGYAGDTLASALLANGVDVVGRSFKYHRPRGIVGAGPEEPNAILQVGSGATTLPNQRATQVELYEGLEAKNVNGWPSVDFDLMAVLGFFSRALSAGFYYKTFMWPASKWPLYEHFIRKSAGWGTVPEGPDPHHYEHRNAHCDVLITGAGPAGIAAALAAGATGARVILCDEQSEMGGQLLSSTAKIGGESATEWVARSLDELRAMPEVTLLTRATAFGHYDCNFVGVLVRESDHLGEHNEVGTIRQRVWRVRAKRVIHTQGAFERSLVFCNNDRPGIMTASAVSTYVNRYAVKPGEQAVVFTNNDGAYQTAMDLHSAGVTVQALVDSRGASSSELADAVAALGIDVLRGHAVTDTRGRKRVKQVKVMQLSDSGKAVLGEPRWLDCDLVAMSGGWSPAVHLHSHAGGKNDWDEAKACFVPGATTQKAAAAGANNGTFELVDCVNEGLARGAEAAMACGYGDGAFPDAPEIESIESSALEPLWCVPAERSIERAPKAFVDFQNDTSASDITLAVREGYRSVEHVKRYTALGFGTDQGKLGNINGMAILAETLGATIPETGTTTFRPAYTPVTFGAGAGREIGANLFEPVRKTAMHAWHEGHHAKFEIVGQWHRPWYYPQSGENMHQAVNRECRAAR
ncbi:MAG: 2Fe-2S iron-sulfur cluster-binding protein, partial [Pseudomonadota bacterium]